MHKTEIQLQMMKRISRMLGKEPAGLFGDILHIFTSPEILPFLEKYIKEIKKEDEKA